MKRFLILIICLATVGFRLSADEGMWLLPYLQKMNYEDMKAKGLKLKATDIYNPNGTSLKDAIVIFGGGCTGEIVSPDGLIFTNHHCGHSNIQQLSSVEHDYLANGFWAMNRAEELPVPGLSVKFVRSIEDVTAVVTEGIPADYTEAQRDEIIEANVAALMEKMQEQYPDKTVDIRAYFGGNQFFATVIDEYTDIRFVGAPPTSIGSFGGETDNWMWPRHTGDFSIFRVYSAPDGTPADYSAENVPYKTPVHLKISAKGYKEGDFAFIMGFPGSTTRYMTTYEIDEMLDVSNPGRIYVRGERQAILRKDMEASDKVRIQYAAKYDMSSNYWKNSIGKSKAVRELKIRDRKDDLENEFRTWAAADPSRERYSTALDLIKESKDNTVQAMGELQYLAETVLSGMEIASMAAIVVNYIPNMLNDDPEGIPAFLEDIYKDYNEATDKKVSKRMIEILIEKLPAESLPGFITDDVLGRFSGDVDAYVDWLYETSAFANLEKAAAFIADFDQQKVMEDPALAVYSTTITRYMALRNHVVQHRDKYREGHRLYIAGLMEMNPDAKHYPDANSTIRLTYGTVLPYSPADAVEYDYYTTLKGVMEKEDESNPTEFAVPARLKELYNTSDYGRYADFTGVTKKDKKNGAPGHLNTCFLTTNDITGGNSGSPVLNAYGELIGLAFDGNWEAMSGDVVFEPELQRCINVDVRYVLFVIDKFAGAGHLLDEMSIVW